MVVKVNVVFSLAWTHVFKHFSNAETQYTGDQNLGDARFTLVGSASPVAAGEVAAVREMFLLQHPDSYWCVLC